EDFSLFLQSRSKELISGGRMVLILLGREVRIMLTKGEIEREKLDSYEVHIYAPSKDELQDEVRRQGSFEMNRLELFEIESDSEHGSTYGMTVAMT
ncbi:unnamed protein product, partial [Ilex paraguariensis]